MEEETRKRLLEQGLLIARVHEEACRRGLATYTDPLSGFEVITRDVHGARKLL